MLMKSEESAAAVDLLSVQSEQCTILDKGTYWQVEAVDEIVLDVDALAAGVGRDVSVEDLLVSLATYVGRIEVSVDTIRVTAEFLQVGDRTNEAALPGAS